MPTEAGSHVAGPPAARPARTRSQIGKSNSAKGKADERKVVSFLRVSGFPEAKRMVRTGFRNGGNFSQDEGDITGTPGVAWQVKSIAEREWWKVPRWLADTQAQKAASGADYGILILKRKGHGHPGTWWAWLRLSDVVGLLGAPLPAPSRTPLDLDVPVRLELSHLMPLLHLAGYGDPAATPLTPLSPGADLEELA